MIATPIKPTMANVDPMAALFFKNEVDPAPVAELPSADLVSLEMATVEVKRRLDVVTRVVAPLVAVEVEVSEVGIWVLAGVEVEETEVEVEVEGVSDGEGSEDGGEVDDGVWTEEDKEEESPKDGKAVFSGELWETADEDSP